MAYHIFMPHGVPTNPAVKQACYEDYMMSSMSLKQIAETHKVPLETMMNWHRDEKWAKAKQSLAQDIRNNFESQIVDLVMKNKLSVAERHLEVAGNLEKLVADMIREGRRADGSVKLSPQEASQLARTLHQAADISGRVVQIDKSGKGSQGSGPAITVNSALIQIGTKPRIPQSAPIDVQSVDVEDWD